MSDNATQWSLATRAVASGIRTLLLAGPPGAGKTYLAMHTPHASNAQGTVHAITLTPDTPAAELRGHWIRASDGHVWSDGVCARAWRESHDMPCRMVLNEIQDVGPDAESILLAFLDSQATAKYLLPSGETITPGDKLQIVATMNGDPSQLLRSALLDRFDAVIALPGSHPEAFAALPTDIIDYARNADIADDVDARITLRRWYAFAKLRDLLDHDESAAAALAFGTRADTILTALQIARS